MINVKDLRKVYKERMSDRDKAIVKEFENFIDEQLVETNGKAKISKWDFLIIINKVIGKLTTKDYMAYKEVFECVESRLNGSGQIMYDGYDYTKEAILLRYILERYYKNGYFIRISCKRIIRIERW